MSDPVLIAIIITAPTLLQIISNFRLHKKVDTVKDEINGRMGELLKITGESEKAKGVIEGKANASTTRETLD